MIPVRVYRKSAVSHNATIRILTVELPGRAQRTATPREIANVVNHGCGSRRSKT